MTRLFAFFVDRPLWVNLIMVCTLVFGTVTFLDIPRTLLPAVESRQVVVSAELPGATAIDMERLVTFRLEEVLQDLEGLEVVTSTTLNGSSTVSLEFVSDHSDMAASVEQAKTRVGTLRRVLPTELMPIEVELVRQDRMPGPQIHLRHADDGNPDHRRAVELLAERLRRIPHVVGVDSSVRKQDLHISFDADALNRAQIDVTFARTAVAEFLRYAPIGQIRHGDRDISVEVDKGFADLDSLRNLPLVVNRAGHTVRLSRVADVGLRFEEERSLSRLDGEPYISLAVVHAADGDTVRVSEQVRAAVEAFELVPDGVVLSVADDPSELISHELGILQSNALAGFVIVLGILLVFLGWRIAAMTAIGLPFCYAGGMLVLDAAGQTFNLVSLFSLILVLGILVDDAIIVAEAFSRRLEQGQSARDAAIGAASDMFRPVAGMMITTTLAFSPILFFTTGPSRVLAALPIAVLALLLFSFFESFFLLPNHLADFWPEGHLIRERRPVSWAKRQYRRLLSVSLRGRYLTVPAFAGLLAGAFWLAGTQMEIKSGKSIGTGVRVHAELAESASLEDIATAVRPIEEALLALRGTEVDRIESELGVSQIGANRVEGFRFASLEIKPPGTMAEQEGHLAAIEAALDPILEDHRTDFAKLYVVHEGDADGRDVVSIFVSGSDRLDFHEIETRIRGVLDDIEGVTDVFIDPERLQASWRFEVDHRRVLAYDLTAEAVAAQLRQHVPGPYLDRVRVRGEELLVYTHFEEDLQPDPDWLDEVDVMTPRGIAIPIRTLGSWQPIETLRKIEHKDLLRVFQVDVVYDAEQTASEDVAASVETALTPLRDQWPGFHISVEEPEGEAETRTWAIKIAVVGLGLIYVCLVLSLNSLLEPLLVMAAIPFGLTGVILALYAHGMDFEFMAIIGVLGLVGVVVNDSLVVLDTIRRGRLERPEATYREVVLDGAESRFQAVVLTSLTTLGGVFPLAYGILGDAGWIQPMVFALGWGLLFATVLTLILLPAMLCVIEDFRRIGRWGASKLKRS